MVQKSPKNKEKTVIDSELQDLFITLHQKLIVAFRKKMEDLEFTIPQMETLRFIFENKEEGPTMKDIAEYLSISAPSATSMIEQLAKKKLVIRKIDVGDRRTVRILSTPKALQIFSIFREIKAYMFGDMLRKLRGDDKKQLTNILKKLI